jgi:hypothetical protein
MLKGHGNEADFLGFLQKSADIFLIEKRLPDSASRRLSDSAESQFKFIITLNG